MKVCYFGTYETDYPRNQIIISGLKKNNVDVVTCHMSLWKFKRHKTDNSLATKVKLGIIQTYNYFKLTYKYFLKTGKHDAVIVGYPGQMDVFLAKILCAIKKKPLIFDAFLSLYDSMVNDRAIVKKGSISAKILHLLDKYSCKLSDVVLLDTNQHIDYFSNEFSIDKNKFRRVFIGADENIFYKREVKKEEIFSVVFHGKFIPLQGTEFIIDAANVLKKEAISFYIIGDGQTYDEIKNKCNLLKLNNVVFYGFVPYEDLPAYLSKADVGLGVFGASEKTNRIIPNKAYEILSVGLPLITGNTEAAREVFTDRKNAVLCNIKDGKAIADAIMFLKGNKKQRELIANEGHKLFKEKLSSVCIGRDVKTILETVVSAD